MTDLALFCLDRHATNMLGQPINEDCRNRIMAFLDNPTTDTWDEITGIVLRSTGLTITLWQAICEIDRTFPQRGRGTDLEGNMVEDWERIPTPEQVRQAIVYLAEKRSA